MTVQELIDELNKIEDKSKRVIYYDGDGKTDIDAVYDIGNKIELI